MKFFSLLIALIFATHAIGANISDNVLNLGTGNNSKRINFKGTPGFIGYDATSGKTIFSNDGTVVKNLGSGGGGGAG